MNASSGGSDHTAEVLLHCPDPACGRLFRVPADRLGRNIHCPACHWRFTARPAGLEARLRAQQDRIVGLDRSPIPRLPLAVLVDSVRSLWNVGSIFRTADACGVSRIVLTGITGCPPRREIQKTALGADEVVAWQYRADPLQALLRLGNEGYATVAIETSERAVPVREMIWPPRLCLVIGNEVTGISPAVLEACRHHVRIPMRGLKDSLNVAVAFGIVAYEASQALGEAPGRDA
jgi:tRNA G18 (ribose-2'-O)-methylase SpoU